MFAHERLFLGVVYFDQQMGAPHAVCWSQSFVFVFKQDFPSLTEEKKGKLHKKCNEMFFLLFLALFYTINDRKKCKKLFSCQKIDLN